MAYQPVYSRCKDAFKVASLLLLLCWQSLALSEILSGTIIDQNGDPIAGSSVQVFQLSGNQISLIGGTTIVGEDGRYEVTVDPGTYFVRAFFNDSDVSLLGAPDSSFIETEDFSVAADTSRDIQFNFVELTGQVSDFNNQAVTGVSISTSLNWSGPEVGGSGRTSTYQVIHQNDSAVTDADGNYRMLLLASQACIDSGSKAEVADCYYDITYQAPANSQLLDKTVSDFPISAGQTLNIDLDVTDQIKPKLLLGPFVQYVTDRSAVVSWTTDEPATGSVQVIGGALYIAPKATTTHEMTITALSAATTYNLTIGADDASGNAMDSVNISFDTSDTPDTKPAEFTRVPTAISIGADQLTIGFCANEPVTASVLLDDTATSLTNPELCHEIVFDQLLTNTAYNITVSIDDLANNGVVTAEPITVTTLPARDSSSPLITQPPVVMDIRDSSAVVRWQTSEPASSQVSFNDGTRYRVLSIEDYSRSHSVYLTGLTADTNYALSVYSVDEAGNATPSTDIIEFRTATTPDTTAPFILGRPGATEVADDYAVIEWLTDESASSVVYWGLSDSNLSNQVADSGFDSRHQIRIENLTPDSRHYFRVESTDLAGNTTTSEVYAFNTSAQAPDDRLEILNNAVVERLTGESVTLSWITNLPADSRLVCEEANRSVEVYKNEFKTKQLITLTGLDYNTTYRCLMYSASVIGYIDTQSITITTLNGPDNVAPQCVADPQVLALGDAAQISWSSDELASAVVQYRVKDSQNSDGQWTNISVSDYLTTASAFIQPLTESTDYEYQILLADTVGNEGSCGPFEFNSGTIAQLPAPSFTITPLVTDITSSSANVSWSTDIAAYGELRYGLAPDQLNFVVSVPELQTSHQVALSQLASATTYYLAVDAINAEGITTTSSVVSFTTLPEPIEPPLIISGPVAKYITQDSAVIEWQTNKPATSELSLSNGFQTASGALTRSHSLLVVGLSPSTTYTATVVSSDENNLSSQPASVDFTTLGIPDTRDPIFLLLPYAYAIDYNRFNIAFCANEPVTGSVFIDGTPITLTEAKICHDVPVTGLTPNTEYEVIVSITDRAGNGPVFANPLYVTTLRFIDAFPPEITGPIVTDITQTSAIVRWTTNEFATSAVYYTDGVSQNFIEDQTLVIEHEMPLTNLTPATTYSVNVYSTDALGNGPAVAGPVEFTTLAEPDTSAPIILNGPYVEDITTNSALVLWQTNESATSLVDLGLSETALDQQFTVSGLTTDHQVPVSQLQADTLYYYQVHSQDLAGNSVSSDVHTFRTAAPGAGIVRLEITDGPTVVDTTTESLTVAWQTNLFSNSRLVCSADATSVNVALSANAMLADYVAADASNAIHNQYIVQLKPHSQLKTLTKRSMDRAQMVDFVATDIAKQLDGKVKKQFNKALDGFVIEMKPSQIDKLRRDYRVQMIEQDQYMFTSATQTGATWGLDRIDQRDLPVDGNYTYDLDGTGVTGYVIDTGILISHPDFGGRARHGWDFIDNDADASDCNGHGTHVAGTMGGTEYGVAKNVALVGIRVLGCSGRGSNSGVIAGVDWVANQASGPSVANMSLGGGSSGILDNAVENAISQGITFVVAAGNSNIDACYGSPNRVPAAITVAASDSNDNRAGYSNWGACI